MVKGLSLKKLVKNYARILYSKYWKGRYEGLHELVSTIPDAGKTAMTVSFY